MWKQSFGQIKNDDKLCRFIERCKFPKNIIEDEKPRHISTQSNSNEIVENAASLCYKNHRERRRRKLDLEYVQEEEEEEAFEWNAFTAPKIEWNTMNISEFLSTSPNKCPKLTKITKCQKSMCNETFFYLCEFQAVDGTVQVWMLATVLYHTPRYRRKYEIAQQKIGPFVHFCGEKNCEDEVK